MNLQTLDQLEQELEFTGFTNEDALQLGNLIIQYAKEKMQLSPSTLNGAAYPSSLI